MAYCCEPGISSQEIEDAARALSLRETEIPVFGATIGEGEKASRIVFASRTMLALFGVADLAALSARLLGGDEAGAKRLVALSSTLPQDGAPRLERASFSLGPEAETLTFLCRKIGGAKRALFVAAALGVKPALLRTESHDEFAAVAAALPEASPEPILRLEEVREILAARLGKRTNIRFLWRTDAEDRFTEITPPLAEVVGAAAADLLGRDFGDVAKYLEREPDGRLGRAFAKHETFSGIEVLWPIAGAAAAVPVGLGGLPAFDRARRFDGYRGFGVIHLERLAAAEPRRFMESVATPSMPPADIPLQPPVAYNVVLLRRPVKPAHSEPREESSLFEAEESGLLSFDEQTAFKAIADVLAEEAATSAEGRDGSGREDAPIVVEEEPQAAARRAGCRGRHASRARAK